MTRVLRSSAKTQQVAKKTVKTAMKAAGKKAVAKVPVKGMHSKKIVTDAYNKRAAFGIPRIPITKAEFCAIRKLDKMFLTTTVFDEIPDGSTITKPVMITNKEVKSLVDYRAKHGFYAYGRVTYDFMWEYSGSDPKGWKKVTEKRCWKYEEEMNEKIKRALVAMIEARGEVVPKHLRE